MEHDHSTDAIRSRLLAGPPITYIRDWVYGGIDGAVTTFAIVASAIGANLSTRVLLIMGVANLIADGFSMAASNYSGTKTEKDDHARMRAFEERQIIADPEGEREEVREIFRIKGFTGEDLERAVTIVTSDPERWVETMLAEEYGMPAVPRSPMMAGASTFAAFLLCGTIPLLPFVAGLNASPEISLALTALVFFGIGSTKSRWSLSPWWRSGFEIVAIGLGAAGLAFLIGFGLKNLI